MSHVSEKLALATTELSFPILMSASVANPMQHFRQLVDLQGNFTYSRHAKSHSFGVRLTHFERISLLNQIKFCISSMASHSFLTSKFNVHSLASQPLFFFFFFGKG